MRRHIHGTQLVDEVLRVIALICAQGDASRRVGAGLDQGERGFPFRMAVCLGEAGIDHQAVRFSIKAWPMKQSLASLPGPLR